MVCVRVYVSVRFCFSFLIFPILAYTYGLSCWFVQCGREAKEFEMETIPPTYTPAAPAALYEKAHFSVQHYWFSSILHVPGSYFLFFFYSFILSFCYRFTGWNPTAFLSINLMEFDVHSATVSMISSTMLNHCYFRIRFLMVFRIIFHLFRHKLSFDFY